MTSVPSDAPDDYAALRDVKNKTVSKSALVKLAHTQRGHLPIVKCRLLKALITWRVSARADISARLSE